jgi:glucose-6-phosphate isomerase
VAALGATDQHSLVQLFMEGPRDKVVTLLTTAEGGDDVPIPTRAGAPEAMAYLSGHSLGHLLRTEAAGTEAALAEAGRMTLRLECPPLGPEMLGELMMFYQLSVGYAGIWYGVDPFDQPGVELGKRLTFAALGRGGVAPVPPASAPRSDRV